MTEKRTICEIVFTPIFLIVFSIDRWSASGLYWKNRTTRACNPIGDVAAIANDLDIGCYLHLGPRLLAERRLHG